jgi:hypothetical protein
MTSPPPHNLKEGTVLKIPPKPVAPAAQADAKVGFVRNKVEVQAPTPKPATLAEPLYRGNRISTQAESAAGVTFRDETRYTLGENTLIVILGDMRSGAQRVQGGETTLVSGELRTRLGELAGRKPHVIQTEGTRVTATTGESVITVDAKKASRVAVHSGASAVSAQNKQVTVNEGFGSKVEVGKAPSPPKPLPALPTVTQAPAVLQFAPEGSVVTSQVRYAPGTLPANAAAVQHWHVQIAQDAEFTAIVSDLRVPLNITEVVTKTPVGATHYVRVSAVDGDVFEGKFTAPAAVGTAAVQVTDGDVGKQVVKLPGMLCSVDGAAEVPADALVVPSTEEHTLRCGLAAAGSPRGEIKLPRKGPAALLPAPTTRIKLLQESAEESTFELYVASAEGRPVTEVPTAKLVPKNASGVSSAAVTALVAVGQGVYRGTVYWKQQHEPHAIMVTQPGHIVAESTPIAPPPPAPTTSRPVRLDFEIGGGLLAAGKSPSEFGGRLILGADIQVPISGGRVILGVRGARDAFGARPIDPAVCGCNGVEGSFSAYSLEVPIGLKFARDGAAWAPYVLMTPGFLSQTGSYKLATGEEIPASATLGQLGIQLGLERKLGPGALFGEVGYRGTTAVKFEFATASHRGGLATLGYRIGFDL